MQFSRRTLIKAGAALSLLPSPLRAQPQANILRCGLSAWPPNLQPWVSTGASAGTVKMLTYGRLVGYDKKGNLAGEIAESFARDPADGAWVFKLKRNAFFHNGDPVTSEDIKWMIEQIAGEKSTAYMRAQFQMVSKIDTPDPHTVRLHTKEPVATLPHWFGNYNMGVISRRSEEHTSELQSH